MKTDIAFIGYEPVGSENLSLRLLAQTVKQGGFDAKVVTAESPREAVDVVNRAMQFKPRVLGISLQDSEQSLHALALAVLARKRGYTGYIVCGGTFATLQPKWVLERCFAVDGIIRHDGEQPVVALLSALKNGQSLKAVPALTCREFSTELSSASLPPVWRPMRGERPAVMGIPTANMIAGRGCGHSCEYCTHAAVASLATRETGVSGVSPQSLKQRGLAGIRRRSLVDLVDEMATLYHNDGVRFFHFIDENPVPAKESAALLWARSLKKLFVENKMTSVGLGLMTRGDCLTPNVVDALVDLGLMRSLVGVESGSDKGLAGVGREGNSIKGKQGLSLLADAGVVTMFNCQMFNPQSSLETIEAELSFLNSVRDTMFETIQVRPFVGTRLHDKLEDLGRLSGGALMPGFTFEDPKVARFAALVTRLRTQVLGRYTPSFQVNDLLFSARLFERFGGQYLGGNGRRCRPVGQLQRLVNEINTAKVHTLAALLDAVKKERDFTPVLASAQEKFGEIKIALNQISGSLEEMTSPSAGVATQYKNLAAAAALVFSMAAVPACHDAGEIDTSEESGDDDDDDNDDNNNDDNDNDDNNNDDTGPDGTDSEGGCSDEMENNQEDVLDDLVTGSCGYFHQDEVEVRVELDANGVVEDVAVYLYSDEEGEVEMRKCYETLLENEVFPCLEGEIFWYSEFADGDIG